MINLDGPLTDANIFGEDVSQPAPYRQPPQVEKMKAAYAGILDEGLPTYTKVREEQETLGISPTAQAVIDRQNKQLNESIRKPDVFLDFMQDESIPEEFRYNGARQAANNELQSNVYQHTSANYLMDANGDETPSEERIRLSFAEDFDTAATAAAHIESYRSKANADIGKASLPDIAIDMGVRVIPFADSLMAQNLHSLQEKGVLPGGDVNSWRGAFGATADVKTTIINVMKNTPIEQREQMIKEMLPAIYANTGLNASLVGVGGDVNETVLREFIDASINLEYDTIDRVFDELGWGVDLLTLGIGGGLVKGVGRGIKSAIKLSKGIGKAKTAETTSKGFDAALGSLKAKGETQAFTGEKSTVSPAQVAANTNPAKSQEMYRVIESSVGDEAAEALAGVGKNDYLITEKMPQLEVEGNIILTKTDGVDSSSMRAKVKEAIDANIPIRGDIGIDETLIRKSQYAKLDDTTRHIKSGKFSFAHTTVGLSETGLKVRQVYNASDNIRYSNVTYALRDMTKEMGKYGVASDDIKVIKWEHGVGRELDGEELANVLKQEKLKPMEDSGAYSLAVDVDYNISLHDVRSFASSGKIKVGKEKRAQDIVFGLFGVDRIMPGGLGASFINPANTHTTKEIYQNMAVGATRSRHEYGKMNKLTEEFEAAYNKMEKGRDVKFRELANTTDLDKPLTRNRLMSEFDGDVNAVKAYENYVAYWRYNQSLRNNTEITLSKADGWKMMSFKDNKGRVTYTRVKPVDSNMLKEISSEEGLISYMRYDKATGETTKHTFSSVEIKSYMNELAGKLGKNEDDLVGIIRALDEATPGKFLMMDKTPASDFVSMLNAGEMYVVKNPVDGKPRFISGSPELVRDIAPYDELIDMKSPRRFASSDEFVVKVNKVTGKRQVVFHGDDALSTQQYAKEMQSANTNDNIEFIRQTTKNDQETTQLAREFYGLRDSAETIEGMKSFGDIAQADKTPFDFLSGMRQANLSLSEQASMASYIHASKSRWLAQYSDLLAADANGFKSFPVKREHIGGSDAKAIRDWEYIRSMEWGDANTISSSWRRGIAQASIAAGELADKSPKLSKAALATVGGVNAMRIENFKKLAQISYISLNPVYQAALGMIDTVVNLGYGRMSYVMNPGRGGYLSDVLAMGAMKTGNVKWAASISGRSEAELKFMWKEFKESGLTSSTELQHAMDAGLRNAPKETSGVLNTPSSVVGKVKRGNVVGATKEALSAPVKLSEKIFIEAPDNYNRMSSWLMAYDRAQAKYGKQLTRQRLDVVLAEAAEVTLDMTKASQPGLPKSALGAPIQFYATPLKAALKLIPGVGNLPTSAKMKMAILTAVVFGIPESIEKKVEELGIDESFPPEVALAAKRGLFNSAIMAASDVEYNEGKLDPFSLSGYEMIWELVTNGSIEYAASRSPTVSKATDIWNLGSDLVSAMVGSEAYPLTGGIVMTRAAQVASSGFSHYLQGRLALNGIQREDFVTEEEFQRAKSDAYATMFGGKSMSRSFYEEQYLYDMGKKEREIKNDAKKWVDEYERNITASLSKMSDKTSVMLDSKSLYHLYRVAPPALREAINDEIVRRIKTADKHAALVSKARDLAGMMSPEDAERMINAHPTLTDPQKDVLRKVAAMNKQQ